MRHLLKSAVVLVVIKVGAQAIVGDEQVGPAIIVIISGAYGKILSLGLIDLGFDGDVGKGSIAVIVVQGVGAATVNTGRATALHSAQVAITLVTQFDVTADVEIESAVAVVVKEGRSGVKRT